MKISWGTGIVIAIVLFMSFILYFVIKVQTNSFYDSELVEDDYYKQEQFIDANMQKAKNLNQLKNQVVIKRVEEGFLIEFPAELNPNKITGKVSLYRPSNQKLDSEIPISLSNDSHLLIPNRLLVDGLWDIILDFECEGIAYLKKETVYF